MHMLICAFHSLQMLKDTFYIILVYMKIFNNKCYYIPVDKMDIQKQLNS